MLRLVWHAVVMVAIVTIAVSVKCIAGADADDTDNDRSRQNADATNRNDPVSSSLPPAVVKTYRALFPGHQIWQASQRGQGIDAEYELIILDPTSTVTTTKQVDSVVVSRLQHYTLILKSTGEVVREEGHPIADDVVPKAVMETFEIWKRPIQKRLLDKGTFLLEWRAHQEEGAERHYSISITLSAVESYAANLKADGTFVKGAEAFEKDGPQKPSSKVTVTGRKLTFDPKTCSEGAEGVAWELGSFRVTVRGHEAGHCLFDYRWEVEGAGNYQIHRVRVPLDSGPVVIEPRFQGKGEPAKNHWSLIYTSFTAAQSQLVFEHAFDWSKHLVEGTNEFVSHQRSTFAAGRQPAAGDRATLRFSVHADDKFERLADKAKQKQTAELTIGANQGWRWLELATTEMTVGEKRRVKVPAKIAEGAKEWVPGVDEKATIYVEMEMVSTARAEVGQPAAAKEGRYAAYLLAEPDGRLNDQQLLLTRMPLTMLSERMKSDELDAQLRPDRRSPSILDAAALTIETNQKDSIWNQDRQPLKPIQGFANLNEKAKTVEVKGVRYRYEECSLAEVVRLLNAPTGKEPLHRLHAPLDGMEQTARALKLLLEEQLRNEQSASESPRNE